MDARKAMATWLGVLGRGGLFWDAQQEAGVALAAYVVGEERLEELRQWMASLDEASRVREQSGAIEVCIWMAHADRELAATEADLLKEIVLDAELDEADRRRLTAAIDDPPSLEGVEDRVTHPVLRELLLALSWELAMADDRVDRFERDFYTGLAHRLGVEAERAMEIRDTIGERLSAPPDA